MVRVSLEADVDAGAVHDRSDLADTLSAHHHPLIIVTFGFMFVQAIRKKVSWMIALPFAINLVANLVFTPIQFGMRNLPLAAVDILIVWGTIMWIIIVTWKTYRWISVAQVPYLVWVSIATVLQLSMTWMNRREQ